MTAQTNSTLQPLLHPRTLRPVDWTVHTVQKMDGLYVNSKGETRYESYVLSQMITRENI